MVQMFVFHFGTFGVWTFWVNFWIFGIKTFGVNFGPEYDEKFKHSNKFVTNIYLNICWCNLFIHLLEV